ncbi:MAG: hypothetical protein PHW04_11260 [Candidatus Wallbacteria bacterium]|nr:hypothetical protein [Candidatus Wallbacteria bacterium]
MKKKDYAAFKEEQLKDLEFKEMYLKEMELLRLAYKLAKLRKEAHLTQADLAKKTALPRVS